MSFLPPEARRILESQFQLVEHYGPGAHPSGSPQAAHAGGPRWRRRIERIERGLVSRDNQQAEDLAVIDSRRRAGRGGWLRAMGSGGELSVGLRSVGVSSRMGLASGPHAVATHTHPVLFSQERALGLSPGDIEAAKFYKEVRVVGRGRPTAQRFRLPQFLRKALRQPEKMDDIEREIVSVIIDAGQNDFVLNRGLQRGSVRRYGRSEKTIGLSVGKGKPRDGVLKTVTDEREHPAARVLDSLRRAYELRKTASPENGTFSLLPREDKSYRQAIRYYERMTGWKLLEAALARRLLRRLVEHYGPGAHPSGSPQAAHAGGGQGATPHWGDGYGEAGGPVVKNTRQSDASLDRDGGTDLPRGSWGSWENAFRNLPGKPIPGHPLGRLSPSGEPLRAPMGLTDAIPVMRRYATATEARRAVQAELLSLTADEPERGYLVEGRTVVAMWQGNMGQVPIREYSPDDGDAAWMERSTAGQLLMHNHPFKTSNGLSDGDISWSWRTGIAIAELNPHTRAGWIYHPPSITDRQDWQVMDAYGGANETTTWHLQKPPLGRKPGEYFHSLTADKQFGIRERVPEIMMEEMMYDLRRQGGLGSIRPIGRWRDRYPEAARFADLLHEETGIKEKRESGRTARPVREAIERPNGDSPDDRAMFAMMEELTGEHMQEHMGPGAHPSGSPQEVHAGGGVGAVAVHVVRSPGGVVGLKYPENRTPEQDADIERQREEMRRLAVRLHQNFPDFLDEWAKDDADIGVNRNWDEYKAAAVNLANRVEAAANPKPPSPVGRGRGDEYYEHAKLYADGTHEGVHWKTPSQVTMADRELLYNDMDDQQVEIGKAADIFGLTPSEFQEQWHRDDVDFGTRRDWIAYRKVLAPHLEQARQDNARREAKAAQSAVSSDPGWPPDAGESAGSGGSYSVNNPDGDLEIRKHSDGSRSIWKPNIVSEEPATSAFSEIVVSRMAKRLGDGSDGHRVFGRVQVRGGTTISELRQDGYSLESLGGSHRGYRVTDQTREDMRLVAFIDHVFNNRDRHSGNGLVVKKDGVGRIAAFDHDLIGNGPRWTQGFGSGQRSVTGFLIYLGKKSDGKLKVSDDGSQYLIKTPPTAQKFKSFAEFKKLIYGDAPLPKEAVYRRMYQKSMSLAYKRYQQAVKDGWFSGDDYSEEEETE